MAEAWSPEFVARVREWCDHVAALGADVLADAGIPNDVISSFRVIEF